MTTKGQVIPLSLSLFDLIKRVPRHHCPTPERGCCVVPHRPSHVCWGLVVWTIVMSSFVFCGGRSPCFSCGNMQLILMLILCSPSSFSGRSMGFLFLGESKISCTRRRNVLENNISIKIGCMFCRRKGRNRRNSELRQIYAELFAFPRKDSICFDRKNHKPASNEESKHFRYFSSFPLTARQHMSREHKGASEDFSRVEI